MDECMKDRLIENEIKEYFNSLEKRIKHGDFPIITDVIKYLSLYFAKKIDEVNNKIELEK